MTTNRYLEWQKDRVGLDNLANLHISHPKPTINNLPEPLLATILSHALPNRRDGFISSIMNTAKMFKKTSPARPTPNFLLVNKKILHIGKQVWLKTDFSHVYINSWTPLHRGLISSAANLPFVVLTLDIRRGERALREKLVPSAFGAKLRELLHEMKNLQVLLIRIWHGLGSLGPVSEIIMNNFANVRVTQAVNVASIVSTERGIDEDRGCPGLLSEFYMENFVSHLLHLPLKDVPKPTTAYLDDSEPLLKIPIWRGCAAAHDSVNSAWLPAVEEGMKSKDKQVESRSAEEEGAMSEAFKENMMDIPWVKAAARAAKRQEKAKNKKMKKKEKKVASEKKGEKE